MSMSLTVCIGIAVHAEPVQLAHTIRFLKTFTDPAVETVLLPDDPDEATARALGADPALVALPQYPSAGAQGMAACFNRLAANSDTEVVVLMESGVLVAPAWLDRLLAALERPGCGLAGPSTNSSWNEQAITRHARPDEKSIRCQSGVALRRFGTAARSLEPLYSLGDFCYAVRREVIDAIGAADEGYGVGPCWEMDYNVRAARAGFRGVWVGASYVYRYPPTQRRHADEAKHFDESRHRYQDRFCGLQIRGESTSYEPHCLGDSCQHFAPHDLMPVVIPLGVPRASPRSCRIDDKNPTERRSTSTARPALAFPRTTEPDPLVSAIMPTRDRPDFALQAVRYFLRQDYPSCELVILESGCSQLAALIPDDPRIRLVSDPCTRSIGAARNLACQHARGEIMIQWDDDDWHGTSRISRQVGPIREGRADITALRDATIFDLPRWRFWRWSTDLHRRMLVRDVHGGTLAFRRSIWERLARYPNRSLAEDAAFLDQAVRRGARLESITADGLFVYVRHGSNSWQLPLADDVPAGWQSVAEPALPSDDRRYYLTRTDQPPSDSSFNPTPLVSCVMPTFDRREFIPAALRYFARQDYPALELIVVDDGTDPIADLIPDDPRIRYHRLENRLVLGAKRNLGCELARGQTIVHWDDDDWYAHNRVSTQVAALDTDGSDLSGMRSLRFYEPAGRRAWEYNWPAPGRIWAAGSSLCYRKALWERSKFPEVATGEDTRFVWSRAARSLADVSHTHTIVAVIHRKNTVPKAPHGANWTSVASQDVEAVLGGDLRFYAAMTATP
jgi:glycosyltransferase involved in cell wall biosynthesis